MNMWSRFPLVLCLALAACGTAEVLESRDGAVPAGADLSGNWVKREIPPAERRRISDAIRKTDGVDDRELYARPSSSQGGRRSSSAALKTRRRDEPMASTAETRSAIETKVREIVCEQLGVSDEEE